MNLSVTARWSENAITVAGSETGMSGSSLNELDYTRGIRIDDNDTLYVTDSNNNRIVLIHPNSTTPIATIGTGQGSQNSQLSYPSDIFLTQSSIYVMDTLNYRVQKWSRNLSNPVTVAGITGVDGQSSNSTAVLASAYHIFVDNYENLYVSDTTNNRVLRFPPNTSSGTNGSIVAGDGTTTLSNKSLNGPFGIFIDGAGTLYIADRLNNRIQKWSFGASSGVTVAGNGTGGNALTQLYSPRTVIVDVNQYMYISDGGNFRILRWAPNSNIGECIAACTGVSGVGSTLLRNAYDHAFDSQGSLYVSDRENNRVQKFQMISGSSESYQSEQLNLMIS